MKTNKRTLFALSLVAMLSFTACGAKAPVSSAPADSGSQPAASSQAPSAPAAGAVKIGVSIADQANPFYIEILDGMKGAVKGEDSLVVMDAGFDAAKQISDIEDMINQGVNVMLVDPVDSNGIQSALQQCKDAKISVIAYNSPVNDATMVASTVASDNFMAGQLIGEALGKQMDGKGEVVMLTYNVAKVCLDRANGFKDSIAKYPEIKIAAEQEIQPGVDTALPVMENMLQAYPSITGVFALNDPSAIGCAAAIESAGLLDKIKIVGVDGSAEGKTAIKEGKMLASAAQYPVKIGSISIETAYKVIAGETVEQDVKVPVELVNAENAG